MITCWVRSNVYSTWKSLPLALEALVRLLPCVRVFKGVCRQQYTLSCDTTKCYCDSGRTMKKTSISSWPSLLHKPTTLTLSKNDHRWRLVIASAHTKPVAPKSCSSEGGTRRKIEWGLKAWLGANILWIQKIQKNFFKITKDLINLSGGLCPHSALLGSGEKKHAFYHTVMEYHVLTSLPLTVKATQPGRSSGWQWRTRTSHQMHVTCRREMSPSAIPNRLVLSHVLLPGACCSSAIPHESSFPLVVSIDTCSSS
jgi:hypothetical protein